VTLVRAALLTGAQGSELTALCWAQVDFDQQTITIGRARTAMLTLKHQPKAEESSTEILRAIE
jgi:integrase